MACSPETVRLSSQKQRTCDSRPSILPTYLAPLSLPAVIEPTDSLHPLHAYKYAPKQASTVTSTRISVVVSPRLWTCDAACEITAGSEVYTPSGISPAYPRLGLSFPSRYSLYSMPRRLPRKPSRRSVAGYLATWEPISKRISRANGLFSAQHHGTHVNHQPTNPSRLE
ncbi:hypothetical protein LX32DRAFT_41377 [Colletotrichum zoysiae]|uniref:Uncharacterized protein n=1 Tax=Colletotrichum zoysiae TaxID=1216348 RepID=A0AAD9HTP6_9PEZI|nr:hypothetical protein LX32DRAFT_41377 [Colletotrichum zoysiae]